MKYLLLFLVGVFSLNGFAQQNQSEIAPEQHAVQISQLDRDTFNLQFSFPCIAFLGEYGVETNGTDFYVTQWRLDSLAKYAQDGTVLEIFKIPGAIKTRDLAYDGQYYYGSPAESFFYVLDLENKVLIDTVFTNFSIRGMAYDPVEGVLWATKKWEPDFSKIDMQGHVLDSWVPSGVTMESITGLAIDNSTPNGPFLWGFSQDSSGAMIVKYDIATQAQTGSMIDVASLTSNQAFAGGLFIRELNSSEEMTMGGIIQNELVFALGLSYANMLVDVGAQDMLTAFKVYPNPATDFVNVHLELADQGQIQYQVMNQLGQVVQQQSLYINGSKDVNINTSQFEPGIYFVQVSNGVGYSFTQKFVKGN